MDVAAMKGQAKKTIKNGDVLFSEIRPKNKRYAFVNVPNPEDYVVSTKLMVLRNKTKDVLTKYIYYFLTYEGTLNYLQMRAENRIGSFPQITFDILKELDVNVPEKAVQQKIVDILSVLDAKIELNQGINAELKSMAKTLYDYWFVQFDFPNEKGQPYKSSGGKMVWNEALKREIPLGWEVDNVLKVGDLLGGGTPKTNEPSYWGGDIPFFTPRDSIDSIFVLSTLQNVTESGLQSCSSRLYPKGTIFITARGTVGNINIAAHEMAMNQSCCVFW
jgi:type I restriction enzyme S subunit